MTSNTWSWILAVLCGGLSIVFFLGKGGGILDRFSSADERGKKRSPENERKYQRVVAFFLLFLCADEVFLALCGGLSRWIPIVSIVLVIFALVITVRCMRKYN